MTTLAATPTILKQTQDEFVPRKTFEQDFVDESEYFAKLANAEHKWKILDYYEKEVMKAIVSDKWSPGTPEFGEKLRKKSQERREARNESLCQL